MQNIPKPMGHNESSAKRKYLQKESWKKFDSSDLTAHLKALEQKEANLPRRSRNEEIIKLRGEINKIETKRSIQRIIERKSWFFVEINHVDEPLSKLTKRQRENIPINKIRNEKGT